MTNKISILILLIALAIPQVVSAAWWNPFSWFAKSVPRTETLENKIIKLEDSNSTTTKAIVPSTQKEAKASSVTSQNIKAEEDLEVRLQQEILNIRLKVEEQLQIDALKAESDRQAKLEVAKKQQTLDEVNEEQEAKQNSPEEVKVTTLTIKDVFCSWGGSANVYTLPFSIEGSWSGGTIAIRSDDGSVRRGGLIYKSDLARDKGYIVGTESGMKNALGQAYGYTIRLYSEGPYFRGTGAGSTPYFPGSSLLVEKTGTFRLPRC
jgi:hypothetical protein